MRYTPTTFPHYVFVTLWTGTFTAASLVANIIEQCEVVVKRHTHLSAEEYVDDGDFRALVSELLDTKAWAKEKVQLWLLDDSQYIRFLQFMSLRDCHRLWLFFIRKCITAASAGFSDDVRASVELLKSRGLIRKGVKGEANVDGEDVLVHAGADGWRASDIAAAVTAGADIFAHSILDGSNGLWKSARYGHLESLNALILAGCDIDNQNTNGATAIYSAARAGNADCVKSLLSSQANMHRCNADGCSPLHAAAGNGHAGCLALLIEAKGNVATCSKLGESPILIATRRGWHACVKLLLEANSELNQCDNRGCSPICMAAFRNRLECLSLLLDARADPSSSWEGKSAFEIAEREGHVECARLLEAAMK
jgi:ankyrin repeat protein